VDLATAAALFLPSPPRPLQFALSVFQGELPASTLIVVKSLFHPDFLIEVEGVAVID